MRLHLSQEDTCQLVVSARAIVTDIMIRQRSNLLDDHLPQGRGAKREVAATLTYQLRGSPSEGEAGMGPKYPGPHECRRGDAQGGHGWTWRRWWVTGGRTVLA